MAVAPPTPEGGLLDQLRGLALSLWGEELPWTALMRALASVDGVVAVREGEAAQGGAGVVELSGGWQLRVERAGWHPAELEALRSLVRGAWAAREAQERAAVGRAWVRRARSVGEELRSALGHDFRTPIAVIEGQCQLLEQGIVGPAQIPRLVASVTKQTGKMEAGLHEQLGRLGALLEPPPTGWMLPRTLATEILARCGRDAQQRGVALRLAGFGEGGPVGAAFAYSVVLAVEGVLAACEEGTELVVEGRGGAGGWVEVRRSVDGAAVGVPSEELVTAWRLLSETGGQLTADAARSEVRLVGVSGERTPAWEGLDGVEASLRAPGGVEGHLLVIRLGGRADALRAHGEDAAERFVEWVRGEVDVRAPAGARRARTGPDLLVLHDREAQGLVRIQGELEALSARARPRVGLGRVQLRLSTAVLDVSRLGVEHVLGRVRGAPADGGSEGQHGA